MNAHQKPTDKEWVEHWRRLGPLLETMRREELRHFNYEEQLPIIDALLQIGLDYAVPRPTSGLVELQRILAKGRREPDRQNMKEEVHDGDNHHNAPGANPAETPGTGQGSENSA